MPPKPLKLTAAGFSCTDGRARHESWRITRGRSLAAIRWAAAAEVWVTLQDLGNIGEFVGAVGVVASLVYLGLQIRQNSKLLRASTMQNMTGGAAMFVSSIAQDPKTAGLLLRGMADYDSLSPEERAHPNQ